jgi:hypothetical protein
LRGFSNKKLPKTYEQVFKHFLPFDRQKIIDGPHGFIFGGVFIGACSGQFAIV